MARLTEYVSVLTVLQAVYRLAAVPLLVVLLPVCGAGAAEPAVSAVAAAATVNGTVITTRDYTQELERLRRRKGISAKNTDEATEALVKREALENLISREILYQESVKQKISIDPSVVGNEVAQAKAQYANPGLFAESLRRINMTETKVREQVMRGLAIQKLIERSLGKNGTVSDEELTTYYAQHQDAFTLPLDDVREKVRDLVRQEKNITALQRYVKGLRDAATVVILLAAE
ncbi:MAG: SurA N-terminal domain-containing protein [Desulfuromonadales bacterium]